MARRKPFPFSTEGKAFLRDFNKDVSRRVKTEQTKLISADNVHALNHGIEWQSHNSSFPNEVSSMTEFQHEMLVQKEDVIAGRVELISQKAAELSEAMISSFARHMYTVVSESCDRIGNTVSAGKKSPTEAILESLERVQFGVDREGKPSLPSIHMHPETYKAIKNDPLMNNPDFKKRIDELTKRKSEEALARESERLSRFKKSND